MTEKWIINDDGEVEDTTTHMTFDSFWELLTVLNGQSRHLNQLSEENEQLKSEKQAIIDVLDEMENGNYFWDRDYLIENISNIESILGLEYD